MDVAATIEASTMLTQQDAALMLLVKTIKASAEMQQQLAEKLIASAAPEGAGANVDVYA